MKIGLKLWSTNDCYYECALSLFQRKVFDYIELYVVPDSLNHLSLWQGLDIPYVLHAPHALGGLNPALSDCEQQNFELISQVEQYRDGLSASHVIFHPGLDGDVTETVKQFDRLKREYPGMAECMLVENKPKVGLHSESCIGASPDEIRYILTEVGIGFCFDIGHAICAANSQQVAWQDMIRRFMEIEADMYHLSDGDILAEMDSHLHFGKGSYDIPEILRYLPEHACISIETEKSFPDTLVDFEEDALWLVGCL